MEEESQYSPCSGNFKLILKFLMTFVPIFWRERAVLLHELDSFTLEGKPRASSHLGLAGFLEIG